MLVRIAALVAVDAPPASYLQRAWIARSVLPSRDCLVLGTPARSLSQPVLPGADTVKTQALAVYRKLGAAFRSEAVARASEAGLIGK